MLTGANLQIHVVQYQAIAARHVDVFEFKKLFEIEARWDFFRGSG
jgi:hypothetical protein